MAYGVAEIDLFQTVDLYEKKGISTVTNTIFQLGAQVRLFSCMEFSLAAFSAKNVSNLSRIFALARLTTTRNGKDPTWAQNRHTRTSGTSPTNRCVLERA